MEPFALGFDPAVKYQTFTMSIIPGGVAKRVRVELRYLYKPGKWFISIFDAATGDPLCLYVPVVASYEYLNNLLEPFSYKGLGSIYCYPVVSEPSSPDPGENNLDEFEIVWGDVA